MKRVAWIVGATLVMGCDPSSSVFGLGSNDVCAHQDGSLDLGDASPWGFTPEDLIDVSSATQWKIYWSNSEADSDVLLPTGGMTTTIRLSNMIFKDAEYDLRSDLPGTVEPLCAEPSMSVGIAASLSSVGPGLSGNVHVKLNLRGELSPENIWLDALASTPVEVDSELSAQLVDAFDQSIPQDVVMSIQQSTSLVDPYLIGSEAYVGGATADNTGGMRLLHCRSPHDSQCVLAEPQ